MIDALQAQLRKGVIEYCILGLLAREPMYGWQLSEQLITDGLIASIGTLYPVLGRLRDRGHIEAYEEPSASGPVRKYYRLTPAGTQELKRFAAAWPAFTATVDRLIASDSPEETRT